MNKLHSGLVHDRLHRCCTDSREVELLVFFRVHFAHNRNIVPAHQEDADRNHAATCIFCKDALRTVLENEVSLLIKALQHPDIVAAVVSDD